MNLCIFLFCHTMADQHKMSEIVNDIYHMSRRFRKECGIIACTRETMPDQEHRRHGQWAQFTARRRSCDDAFFSYDGRAIIIDNFYFTRRLNDESVEWQSMRLFMGTLGNPRHFHYGYADEFNCNTCNEINCYIKVGKYIYHKQHKESPYVVMASLTVYTIVLHKNAFYDGDKLRQTVLKCFIYAVPREYLLMLECQQRQEKAKCFTDGSKLPDDIYELVKRKSTAGHYAPSK